MFGIRNKKAVIAGCFLLSLTAFVFSKTMTVGILTDSPGNRNEELKRMFVNEVKDLIPARDTIRFISGKASVNTGTPKQIKRNFVSMLNNPEVDVICALGIVSSAIAVEIKDFPKPVIAPFIVDHDLQHVPHIRGRSGISNLCYLTMSESIPQDLRFFREVTAFEHCAVLFSKSYTEAIPGLEAYLAEVGEKLQCKLECIPVDTSAEIVLTSIPQHVDAVYIAGQMQMNESDFAHLVRGLKERRLPSFSPFGTKDVERGVMVARIPDPFPRIARRLAVSVQKILMNEDPAEYNVHLSINEQLSFNLETARAIGFEPPWHVFNEANIFGNVSEMSQKVLSLKDAVEDAVENNLAYRARHHETMVSKYEVLAARSRLMPRLEFGAVASAIEEEVASVSAGMPPQYSAMASASLTQVLFSEQALAGISIAKHARKARQNLFQQQRLDLTADVASAYFDVLQAIALEKIARKTMEQSRNYLQLAHIRIAVGTSNKSEEYRWESRIALNLKDLIEANARRNTAEIQLNRLLEHPQEQRIHIREDREDPSEHLHLWEHYNRCFESKAGFKQFRTFFVTVAIENSPELKAIDEESAVYARQLKTAKRAVWLPTLAMQAKAEGMIFKEGTGADYTPPLPPGVTAPDDINLSMGIKLSLPIYSGTDAYAKIKTASETVKQKELERESVKRSIEQRVRTSLHLCGSAYASLQQSMKAADAARNAGEMIRDAYAQGLVSFTELSDAQTQEQIAEAASAQAMFGYLKMLMQVQRAAGQFDFFRTAEELDTFKNRLKAISVQG